jgi:hypothetical protein
MTQNPRTSLPLGRIAIGAATFAAPEVLGGMFGFQPGADGAASFMARLFGVRDVALGLGTLLSSGEAQDLWWRLGILCDAGDAATGWLAVRAGAPKRGPVMTMAVALAAVGVGIGAARSTA